MPGERPCYWRLAILPLLLGAGPIAPATGPATRRLATTLPAVALDPRSPAVWLGRALDQWEAAPREATAAAPPSPLMLIALGQVAATDPRIDQTLTFLANETAACDTAAGRAFGFLRLAMFPAASPGDRARWIARARRAAAEVDSPSLKPLVDLELLTALARTGDFASALTITRATAGVQPRAAQYCAVALAAGAKGDSSACREYLRAARRLVAGQDEETVGVILLKVGQVQAAMADTRAVRVTVDAMPGPRSQIELLGELARRQRAVGDLPGYVDSVRAAADAVARVPEESRLAAVIQLATIQLDAGDTAGAKETLAGGRVWVDAAPGLPDRIAGLHALALATARAGDAAACAELTLAADTAGLKLPAPTTRGADPLPRAAIGTVIALARAGQLDTAESLAKRYRGVGDSAELDWTLAEARARRGHLPDALAHFGRLRLPTYRAWAARRIAEAYAAREQFVALDEFVDRLTPAERAWADLGAAEGLIGHRITDRSNSAFCQLGVD